MACASCHERDLRFKVAERRQHDPRRLRDAQEQLYSSTLHSCALSTPACQTFNFKALAQRRANARGSFDMTAAASTRPTKRLPLQMAASEL